MFKQKLIFIGTLVLFSSLFGQVSKTSNPYAHKMLQSETKESGFFLHSRRDPYSEQLGDFLMGRHSNRNHLPVPLPGSRPFNTQGGNALQAIISDFQVNENAGPSGAAQKFPSIAANDAGNFIVVWEDYRNGAWWDIYAQRYSADGTPIGSNFKINDENSNIDPEYAPSIAMDNAGDFIVVWTDGRNGGNDIYAQRYSSAGTAIGSNFKINDDSGSTDQEIPSIAMDNAGNFTVVWTDGRNGNSDIFAQRYSSDGTAIGTNFKINDDSSSAWQNSPSIAVDGAGNFIVVWTDYRNGWTSDIYAQRYSADGTAIGSNFRINDNSDSTDQNIPSIAMDNAGNFIVVWGDNRNHDDDIYAQRYSSNGTALGSNFCVNDDSSNQEQGSPSIAVDGTGNFIIVWTDNRNNYSDIFAQRYSSDGTAIGSNFKINNNSSSQGQWYPSIAVDGAGNFTVVWQDFRNDNGGDIYAQRYSPVGTAIGSNFKINDDSGSANQDFPSIAVDNTGNFTVVWQDFRNDNGGDIYAQHYSADGTAIGTNFKINDDSGDQNQWYPSIAVDSTGDFTVVWQDGRNGDFDIYAQRYSSDGTAIGSNFCVNDDSGSAYQGLPSIAADEAGNFIVVWIDYRNGGSDIYAQRYSADGTAIGSNFCVNDDNGSADGLPSIATDNAGNFTVVWTDERNGSDDIYAQRYSADGTPIGSNFCVNDDNGSADQDLASIAADEAGNFIVVWIDNRNDNYWDIYAQRYSANGTPIGSNFCVNDDSSSAVQVFPSIAVDNAGNFIIVWEDYRNSYYNSDIYAQRYSADGTAIGNNFLVTEKTKKNQLSPDVKLWQGRIYNVWRSNHVGGTGYDIWANVLDWNTPTVVTDNSNQILNTFQLFQNYPNPFNPSTTISFALPKAQKVTIDLFDLSGRHIKTIYSGIKTAGGHEISFNAGGLSSGVYLYRIKAGKYSAVRRMTLLK